MSFNPFAFVAQLGVSYLLGRVAARDGPRMRDTQAANGDYGVGLPRLYGNRVRIPLSTMAQAEIEETEHEVQDYSEVVGAISGAAAGWMVGGPIGAVVGGILGGLLGAATPNQKYYTYSVTFAVMIADRKNDDPIEAVNKLWGQGRTIFNSAEQSATSETLDGDGNLVVREYGKNRYFGRLRIYGGGSDQTPDDILEGAIGEQPAYKKRAYAVIEDLQLEYWGNAIPQIEGLVQAKAGQTLAEFADAVCAESGIDPVYNLSSTQLIGETIEGYAITDETTCWDALKPLFPVYRVDAGEVGGQIQFHQRDQSMRATIPVDEMGAHEYGNSPPRPYEFTRQVDIKLPKETSLTFVDPARDYQPNTASSQRSEGDANSNISISLPLTLTADQGATAAATLHWDAWLGRTALTTTFVDAWSGLAPGVGYGIPIAGEVMPYRMTRRVRGANGIIEAEFQSDEKIAYRGVVEHTSGTGVIEESTLFADTVVVPLDMPIQSDDHDDFGFYIAVGATEPYWNRAKVQVSGDGGTTWANAIDATETATMGNVQGTLAAGTTDGTDDTLDTSTVLTVELLHDGLTLGDATDADLDAYENFAFVGANGQGEYLQWKTTTKIAPRTWELTNLRRGRRGTDHAIATHSANEQFVLLGAGGIYRIVATDNSGWGDELTLRGVTLYQDEADAGEVTFTNTGEGKRPFRPIDLDGTLSGSDLELTATSRSRFYGDDLDVPEEFEWEFERGGTIVRTETTATPAYTYIGTDQASDGYTDGDAIVVKLYRVNDDYGRSRVATFAYLSAAWTWHLEDDTTRFLQEDDITPIGLG